MTGKKKYKKRKRGYRKFFSQPKKGCRPYKGLSGVASLRASIELDSTNDFIAGCGSPSSKSNVAAQFEGFPGFDVPPLRPIRVLSLFDGIETALCILDKLNIEVEAYFSSEVDEKALSVLKFQHHSRMHMVGCVRSITPERLRSFGRIDLLVGGSPCSDLSLVNPNRRGLDDPSSSGSLFYEYHRILQYLTTAAKERGDQFFWLFENTFSMKKKTHDTITRYLGVSPIVQCASSYVGMRRKRYFWGNINHVPRGMDYDPLELQHFLKPYREATVNSISTLTSTSHSQRSGKTRQLPVIEGGVESHLFITEQEKLFGFPEHYTDGPNLSITDRRKLLGKAWSIEVVSELLRPLCLHFRTKVVPSRQGWK